MIVGLTYDLRKDYLAMGFDEEETGEFDSVDTIEKLSEAIRANGHEPVPIGNIYELVRALAEGKRWDLVFNITEGLFGRSREAQVPALLEAYGIPYTFSDPLVLALTLDKSMTKRVVGASGVPTPEHFLVEGMEHLGALKQWATPEKFPLFAKPNHEGTGKGVDVDSIARDPDSLVAAVTRRLGAYKQPVLVEQYLPGREFTVGIVGTGAEARTIGVLEIKLLENADPLVYSFMNKELCEERVEYTLVRQEQEIIKEASEVALRAYRVLECRDAGRVDLKKDNRGRISFIEINPLSGLNPSHSDLPMLCTQAGLEYKDLIGGIIRSASARISPEGFKYKLPGTRTMDNVHGG